MRSTGLRMTAAMSLSLFSISIASGSPLAHRETEVGFVQGRPWAHFSRFLFSTHIQEVVDIGSGKQNGAAQFRYILKLTTTRIRGKPVVQWADSMTCPTISPIIANMAKFSMPTPAPEGVPGVSQDIVLDGANYELSAPSTDVQGGMTITSNYGSPMSLWMENAFKGLAHCWSASPPRQ